jgi:hypothetical protein
MVLAISVVPATSDDVLTRSPNKTLKNPAGRAASTIASCAVSGGVRCQTRHVDPFAAIIRPTLLQSLEKHGDQLSLSNPQRSYGQAFSLVKFDPFMGSDRLSPL